MANAGPNTNGSQVSLTIGWTTHRACTLVELIYCLQSSGSLMQ
jgi:hypothetical protein